MANKKVSTTKKTNTKKFTNVLVALADDKYGSIVADFVSNYHWPANTQLRLLYVLEEHAIRNILRFSPQLAEQIVENDEEYGEELLKRCKKRLQKSLPNIKIETYLVRGSAKDEILSNAKNMKANVIVMGSHGRTGVTSVLLGSVSMSVASHAHCSVVIVRST